YQPDVVRSFRLEPKPGVFSREQVIIGWGKPEKGGVQDGVPFMMYNSGLVVYFDKDILNAVSMWFTRPPPGADAEGATPAAPPPPPARAPPLGRRTRSPNRRTGPRGSPAQSSRKPRRSASARSAGRASGRRRQISRNRFWVSQSPNHTPSRQARSISASVDWA